jgi:hypothetical protein
MLLGLAVVLVIYQFGRNDFLEPNPAVPTRILSSKTSAVPFRIASAKPHLAKYLTIVNARNSSAMSGLRLTGKRTYYYRIGILNGKVEALDYLESPIEGMKPCLSRAHWESLRALLAEAEICESEEIEELGGTVHCGMNYTMPFAILEFDPTLKYNLGEKNTGCDYPTSLCGDAQKQLLSWVQKVIPGINKASACDKL